MQLKQTFRWINEVLLNSLTVCYVHISSESLDIQFWKAGNYRNPKIQWVRHVDSMLTCVFIAYLFQPIKTLKVCSRPFTPYTAVTYPDTQNKRARGCLQVLSLFAMTGLFYVSFIFFSWILNWIRFILEVNIINMAKWYSVQLTC